MKTPACKRKNYSDSLKVKNLNTFKRKFNKKKENKIIQNSLCSNLLYRVSEVREYMQSRDSDFSHTLDPELEISNQGLSGRCWMFAVLNVMRHELIRKFNLTHEFELSESYLCFYEKLEKCNYFLSEFIDADNVDVNDSHIRNVLNSGCGDGGLWVTCANLIKKYGIIPKSCYRESVNSFSTETMNETINLKLKEFALELTAEKDKSKRASLKNKMMNKIYEILCKMLGTPPGPDEYFRWSFVLYLNLSDQLEREKERKKNGDEYENLQIKNTFDITPLEFYEKFIVNSLDNYAKFGNDPRNQYDKYFQSFDRDSVVEGERNGFYNTTMDVISQMCVASIINNTPVEFDCDVLKYLNPDEELMDNNCYDYNLVFGENFDNLSKEQLLRCMGSYPNHAMVLVGVDIDENGDILKWKVENSWGRNENSTGYYTMSHEWFMKYAYNVVIQKKYVPDDLMVKYEIEVENPETLPKFDIMG